jgi:hypothetical protein
MQDVLKNIEQSLIEHPRKVTIIYLNPSCDELIVSGDIFTRTEELPHFEHKCFIYSNQSVSG